MDRADRIIVADNKRMSKILDWYFANGLDGPLPNNPMENGFIEFQEEDIGLYFEAGTRRTHFAVSCLSKPGLTICEADLDNATASMLPGVEVNSHTDAGAKAVEWLLAFDNTLEKLRVKYLALMSLLLHYREEITQVHQIFVQNLKRKPGKRGKKKGAPSSFIRRVYVIPDENKVQSIARPKRKHTPPDHSVSVRGFYRHYKSGKVVWVKPHTRWRDRGETDPRTYVVPEL